MALDLGDRRVGVALSDQGGRVALPLPTLEVTSARQALEGVADLILRHHPAEVVLGLPLNMNGSEGPRAGKTRRFAASLEAATGVRVTLADERLTTALAQRSLIEAGMRRERRRGVVDRLAAVILLQDHLDRREAGGG
jgi:putative Holliday junction resolvase